METVAGIFQSSADAERGITQLRSLGLPKEAIVFLTPGTSRDAVERSVRVTESEAPGIGRAMGGAVGGAIGAASGTTLGAAVATLMVPGVGPVLAAGVLGAAILGVGGAAAGMVAGDALDEGLEEGLPHDELFVYEDALRKGHSVVIALVEDDDVADRARNLLLQSRAESIDSARELWWLGLRDGEAAQYQDQGHNFAADEKNFRRGFEAALSSKMRGRTHQQATPDLSRTFPEASTEKAFKRGYERGQAYQKLLQKPELKGPPFCTIS